MELTEVNYLSSSLMTETEARLLVDEIKSGISSISKKILELYDRKGWAALGYSSWRECVMTELDFQKSHAYELLNFARVEQNLSAIAEKYPLPQNEAQTRPLTQLPPEQQPAAWQQAIEESPNGNPTSAQVKKVVEQYKRVEYIPVSSKKSYYTIEEWNLLTQDQRQDILSEKGNKQFNKQDSDNIEWARWSWNPITGCLHNCAYCYARDIANRFYTQGFEPVIIPDRLTAPSNTKLPDLGKYSDPVDRMGWRNVFTCSMADLFGKWVPAEWIQAILEQVKNNPQWTFLFLTKFPIRMAEFDYPSNVWLGTTVDYKHAIERAEKAFRKIKASGFDGICWLSCEPMMERLTFTSLEMFDWVVIGGSSKSTQTPEFKPHREWVNHLEDQALKSNAKIYEKTNLLERIREYP